MKTDPKTLPHVHNFSGYVLSVRGLRQVYELLDKACQTKEPQKGPVETMKHGKQTMIVQPNGMVVK